jgi:hypothetical protein
VGNHLRKYLLRRKQGDNVKKDFREADDDGRFIKLA